MVEVPSYLAGPEQATGLIPPGSTTFHLLLAVHIAAGLTCVVTEVIQLMRQTIPAEHQGHVATGVIVKVRKPR
jgi:hypothetical protein